MDDSDKYKNELKSIEEAIMKDPNDSNNHNDRGNLLVKMGLNSEAIKEYES
jgi:regulator of sirC expression with transglutaminase-like and TPR domain